jgi:regulatory protein
MKSGCPDKFLMQKAGLLLGRRAFSRGELRFRLLKFSGEDEVESVLDRLEELGLLNDAEYAYNFALRRLRDMGWGPAKVRHSLMRKHIPAGAAEVALERVRGIVGDADVLNRYLDKLARNTGLPTDQRGIRKLMSHLRNRGFQDEQIWQSLRERIPADHWRRHETGD